MVRNESKVPFIKRKHSKEVGLESELGGNGEIRNISCSPRKNRSV